MKSSRDRRADLFTTELELPPSIKLTVQGVDYSGKTWWCLTAPGPIALISIDPGTRDTLHEYRKTKAGKKKEIHYAPLKLTIPSVTRARATRGNRDAMEKVKDLAGDHWADIEDSVGYVVANVDMFRTVILDNFTDMYERVRLAAFGKSWQVPRELYPPINANMDALVMSLVNEERLNVLFIHHEDAEFIETKDEQGKKRNRETGQLKRAGWKRIGNKVQAQIRIGYDKDRKTKEESRYVEVVKSRMMPGLNGERWEIPPADFAFVAAQLLPELDESVWE